MYVLCVRARILCILCVVSASISVYFVYMFVVLCVCVCVCCAVYFCGVCLC